ncbi:MAG: ribosome-associated translation inhibitor RaiA [candidate division Zixibacteria bacterium]|nr:ribosome-associated translation inhibitor RaiA [candidate division Zixibacteria bacterium]
MLKKITARHFDLTPEIKDSAEEEMDRLTRYYENIISAELVLDAERHRRRAELKVNVYNNTISGSEESDDMYVSIAKAVDKVIGQLKKYKGKLKNRQPEAISETKRDLTRPNIKDDDLDI